MFPNQNTNEVLAVSIAINYVMDLSYPAGYAQVLELMQELILDDPFPHKTTALRKFSAKF